MKTSLPYWYITGFAALVLTILFPTSVIAQDNYALLKVVKGKIINNTGEAVIAAITIKGTAIATGSNAQGEFSLENVKSNAVLVITGINIETIEIPVGGKPDLGIIKVKINVREEDGIIVEANTGYQVLKINEQNGSIVNINNKVLNQQVGTDVLKRLDGVTSGLLFNIGKNNGNQSKTNISIRGLSSIRGPLDPLIVLDDFVYEGDFTNINPNDIENISVLKDASATSIWGTRAANGVIVITTKKGKLNQKPRMGFTSTLITSRKPDLYRLQQMSSSDYIELEQTLFKDGFFDDQIMFSNYLALSPAVDIFLKKQNGQISEQDSIRSIQALYNHDVRDDYSKYFYKQSSTQQYSINISGGGNINAFHLSMGYDYRNGEQYNQLQKLNLRFENNIRLAKNLDLNVGILYTNSKSTTGRPAYNSITILGRQVPYIQLAGDNGEALPVSVLYNGDYVDTIAGGTMPDWKYYPLENYNYDKSNTSVKDLFGYFSLRYKVTKDFSLDFKYQAQEQKNEYERNAGIESYYTRSLINLYSVINRSNNAIQRPVPYGGLLSINDSKIQSYTGRLQASFDKKWKKNHVSLLAGAEIREAKSNGYQFTTYGYSSDPLKVSNVDFINPYPTFFTGNLQSIPGGPSFNDRTNRFISEYSNFVYIRKERYLLSASARRDGSNIFGVNTNDKWKPLWSVGAGWVLSKESFYGVEQLPYLKIRTTYGYGGNVDVSKSALPVARYFSNSSITGFPVARISSINNPSLRWEQSRQINLALDFSSKRNILTGSVDFYFKKGTDLYGESAYDYTTYGASNEILQNIASMKGKGLDIVLNSKNIDHTFKWYSTVLFNYNESKTTKFLSPSAQKLTSLLGGGNSIMPVVGKPLYGIVAYSWGGLDKEGNPQGLINGELTTDYSALAVSSAKDAIQSGTLKYVGSGTPKYFGSIINTFSWRAISLTANISYKFSYCFLKPSINYYMLIYNGMGHSDYGKRWQKPGDELITNVPKSDYPNNNSMRDDFYTLSEVNVLRADHIRLQYINLAYKFMNNKIGSNLKDVEVYCNLSNVGILWRSNREKLDPDYVNTISPSFSWALGIRANF